MSGLQFKLDTDFEFGTTVVRDTRITNGSLVLLEPARESLTGIPTALYNFAEPEAQKTVGNIATIAVQNTIGLAPGGRVERTAKGGIHGIYPPVQASAPSSRACFSARLPLALEDYVLANQDHSFYLSLIGRITRDTVSSASAQLAGLFTNPSGGSEQSVSVVQSTGAKTIAGLTTGDKLINRMSGVSSSDIFLCDVAQSGLELVSNPTQDSARRDLFTLGGLSAALYQGYPSWIFYTLYIEDLTVSGQTYAQAHAKSEEVYNTRKNTFYANDTFTAT